ncbi:MAG TPA: Nramp family divalent metal transporter [Acidobacteriota bacterium]|nr:Nramp family divalent metal transporter [Acidobacteriota bacterium]
MQEVHGTVPVPSRASWIRRALAFSGPAYLVSVGYMDPGNWATDLAGGAKFGYRLLWVLLLSNLMAVLLQSLAARLGVVTGKDLAQACRDYYPRALTYPLWILAEIAIIACDLAEVLGAAIGLKLLFGVPILFGVTIMAVDVLLLLALSRFGMRRLEAVILALVATMGLCFAVEIALSKPAIAELVRGFVPRGDDGRFSLFAPVAGGGWSFLGLHGESLYIAIGILGATVMPHNLYLHSALVQSRVVGRSAEEKRRATRMNLFDTVVALNAAFFVNAAILIVAAAAFHATGHQDVARLEDAHRLLAPLLGTSAASVLFAVALLASGQSSTITGTLAGQVVMEGFLRLRIQPWLRRAVSRGLAIIPAALVIGLRGEGAVDDLLVLSQVVLSLQLSFAIVPLITFTSQRSRMGEFANPPWIVGLACLVAALIVTLNGRLVAEVLSQWYAASPGAWWLTALVTPALAAVVLLLAVIVGMPLLQKLRLVPVPAPVPTVPEAVTLGARATAIAHRARIVVEEGPKRVALALELGPADLPVLEHVCSMPLPADAEIILLHVAESAASRYLGPESRDLETRDDLAALERVAEELRAVGLPARVLLGNGDVKRELARLVREVEADLLVTGSHGHRFLGDLFLGATASGIRHRVACPVLTIRARR